MLKKVKKSFMECERDIGIRKSEFVAKTQHLCSDVKVLTNYSTVGPMKLWNRKTTI